MEELAPIERRAFIQGLIASAVAAGVPLPINAEPVHDQYTYFFWNHPEHGAGKHHCRKADLEFYQREFVKNGFITMMIVS